MDRCSVCRTTVTCEMARKRQTLPACFKPQYGQNSGVGTVAATAVLAAALLQSIKNFIKN